MHGIPSIEGAPKWKVGAHEIILASCFITYRKIKGVAENGHISKAVLRPVNGDGNL